MNRYLLYKHTVSSEDTHRDSHSWLLLGRDLCTVYMPSCNS